MRLAIWQMDATPRPPAALEDYVKFAAQYGADVIVFPELLGCWLSAPPTKLPRWVLRLEAALALAYAGFIDSPVLAAFNIDKLSAAKASDMLLAKLLRALGISGCIKRWLARMSEQLFLRYFSHLAQSYACWIVPGSIIRALGRRLHNTAYLIAPTGEVVLRADKMKPLLIEQALGIQPGKPSRTWPITVCGRTTNVALAVCNDVTPPAPLDAPAETCVLVPSGGWAPKGWRWTWNREMAHIETARKLGCFIARSYFCTGGLFDGLKAAGRASFVGPSGAVGIAPYGQPGTLICDIENGARCEWIAYDAR